MAKSPFPPKPAAGKKKKKAPFPPIRPGAKAPAKGGKKLPPFMNPGMSDI